MLEPNLMPATGLAQMLYQGVVAQLQSRLQEGISNFQPKVFINEVHSLQERLLSRGNEIPLLSRLFSHFDDLHSDSELTPDHAQALLDRLKTEPLPSLIPGYEVRRLVGSGGFSRVYEAVETETNRTVAIKVAAKSELKDRSETSIEIRKLTDAFENEWDVLSRFRDSERIVNVEGRGLTERRKPYLVMEYMDGGTLSSFFGAVNAGLMTFDLDVMLPAMLETARAVAELHAAGLIHNDLKASNFLMSEDGRIKLSDLAMATTVEEARLNSGNRARRGTPGFNAPQTTEGQRNDVFSLGVVFYKALTGTMPYSDKVQTLLRLSPLLALGHKAEKPSVARPDRSLPPRFDSVVLKCVNLDASKRYENAVGLADDLQKLTRKKARKKAI